MSHQWIHRPPPVFHFDQYWYQATVNHKFSCPCYSAPYGCGGVHVTFNDGGQDTRVTFHAGESVNLRGESREHTNSDGNVDYVSVLTPAGWINVWTLYSKGTGQPSGVNFCTLNYVQRW